MEIKHVTVIGAGTMGNGIAHVFAQFGFKVILTDISEAQLQKALQTITGNLDRQIKKRHSKRRSKSSHTSKPANRKGYCHIGKRGRPCSGSSH